PHAPRRARLRLHLETLEDRLTPTFAASLNFATGPFNPFAVAVGDFNRDGRPDLVTSNPGGNTLSLLVGNGDGTFQAATTLPVGNLPQYLLVADLNGDAKLDLAVPLSGDNAVAVLL